MTSPTQRTLSLCKRNGIEAGIVEKWNHHAHIRQDLFGFIDIVAMNGGNVIGIQATSGSNVSARVKKILANPKALLWLRSGGLLYVHGWRKPAKSRRWECREVEITVEMFAESEAE